MPTALTDLPEGCVEDSLDVIELRDLHPVIGRAKGLGSADKADVNFMINVLPFLRGAKLRKKFFKSAFVRRLVLEPSQKVEGFRLGKVSAVVKTTRDGWQVFHPDAHVLGLLFEYLSTLILGQRPPCICLSDGNERSVRCLGTAQTFLLGHELLLLGALNVPIIACDAAKRPATRRG